MEYGQLLKKFSSIIQVWLNLHVTVERVIHQCNSPVIFSRSCAGDHFKRTFRLLGEIGAFLDTVVCTSHPDGRTVRICTIAICIINKIRMAGKLLFRDDIDIYQETWM